MRSVRYVAPALLKVMVPMTRGMLTGGAVPGPPAGGPSGERCLEHSGFMQSKRTRRAHPRRAHPQPPNPEPERQTTRPSFSGLPESESAGPRKSWL